MSTILRALKKLEQDKETLGARGMSHTAATDDSATGRPAGRFGNSKRLLRAAVIGVAFFGISGAAAYFYFQSRPPATQASRSSETVRKPARPQATAPVQGVINRSDSGTAPSEQPPQQTKPAPQRKPSLNQPTRSTTAGAGAPAKPVPPKRIESRERLEKGQNRPVASPPGKATVSKAEAEVAGPRAAPADTAASAGSAPPSETRSEDESAYANADRLMDDRLKIQAIAWSPIPDERMAVINSRIVREGGSVEGFSVVAIRSDDVIVREKGRLYRVIFGSP